jgi:hypothetical protein
MLEPDPTARLRNIAEVRATMEAGGGRSSRAGRDQKRSAESAREHTETALAVSSSVRALARTPAPFNVIVWMATALGSGLLMFTELVFLPLLWVLIKVLDAKGEDEDYEDLRKTVQDNRKSLQFVARKTSPLRE